MVSAELLSAPSGAGGVWIEKVSCSESSSNNCLADYIASTDY
jgi:hypothetical protein